MIFPITALTIIWELSILDESAKPFETLQGANGQRLNLAGYMKEHLYMFSGEAMRVKFWITKRMIGEAVELFGKEIAFSDETADGVAVTVHTNELSAEQFAKTYIRTSCCWNHRGWRKE